MCGWVQGRLVAGTAVDAVKREVHTVLLLLSRTLYVWAKQTMSPPVSILWDWAGHPGHDPEAYGDRLIVLVSSSYALKYTLGGWT